MADDILYHYTDLNGFLGIIQQRKLWLTSAFNLNDHQEVIWARRRIHDKLDKLLGKSDDYLCDLIKQTLATDQIAPYVCSLTSAPDLLSQWRAYSQDGTGVSIGFKRNALPQMASSPPTIVDPTVLAKVEYKVKEQDKSIKAIIDLVIRAYNESPTESFFPAMFKLFGITPTFKNPAFREENEWRIIHTSTYEEGLGEGDIRLVDSISSPKFRISGSKLITYFEYELVGATPSDIFAEVVLGPKCETLDHDLKIFLSQNGLGDLPFRRSKASYR